jgi:hypothetical protein
LSNRCFPSLRKQETKIILQAVPRAGPLLQKVKTIMTAGTERDLLTRAEELADTADLASRIIEIIGRARAARVDQAALGGLVTAVRVLDGDVTALFRAVRGRHPGGAFDRDTGLLEAAEEIEDDISARIRSAAQLERQADEARRRARADEAAAARALAAAHAMPIAEPCRGCHPAKASAIAAAHSDLEDARERGSYASAALDTLAPLKLPQALRAVRRVPEDLREVYEPAYDLVTRDPRAMPKDGDFITGETSSAAMAAKMLAARARTPDPASGTAGPGVQASALTPRERNTPLTTQTTYTHPDVLTVGAHEGWAEPETDPSRIDWPARQAAAAIPFQVIGGRPVNPCEVTSVRYGRNELGLWGENLMADALVTISCGHYRYLLMVERGDGYGWAVPGGAAEAGETARASRAARAGRGDQSHHRTRGCPRGKSRVRA